jgi:hypothetical protein
LIKFTHFFSERLRWVTSGGGWKRKEEERKGGKSEKQVVGGGEKGVGIADGEQRKGDKDARGGGGEGELPGRDPGRRGGSYLWGIRGGEERGERGGGLRTCEGSGGMPFSQQGSLVWRRAARAMLSLVITLLSMSSWPLACSIASWLNSTSCSFTRINWKPEQSKRFKK